MWDWADPIAYLHDVVSTDRRNPTVNANGPVYGALELSADYLPVLDPVRHAKSQVALTVRDPNTPPTSPKMPAPSPYWGSEVIWTSRNNVHNPMFDELGRMWVTSAVRPPDNPDYCKAGSNHPSAKLFPIERASRHLAMWDPKAKKLTHISTCFGTHHLMFAEDANQTLWTSGGGQVVGWLNRKMFEETGDEAKSQGLDGAHSRHERQRRRDRGGRAGRATRSDEGQALRRGLLLGGAGARRFGVGHAARISRRGHPIESRIEPARDGAGGSLRATVQRSEERRDSLRAAVTSIATACIWAALASGHLASFDRRKCKGPLNGPKATGQHCPEGWTLYAEPLPQMTGVTDPGSAEAQLLHVGGSVRHVRAGQEHPDQHRQRVRGAAGAEGRQVGGASRAVSARLLHQMDGRPHRRSERRMEGQGAVGDGQHARAVPYGRREGHDQQSVEAAAPPRSAGALTTSTLAAGPASGG